MPKKTKNVDYAADIKEVKKLAREALTLGGKLAREAKNRYSQADPATKRKIKKAALLGALGLAAACGAKKAITKAKRIKR